MKNFIKHISFLLLASSLFVACNKDVETVDDNLPGPDKGCLLVDVNINAITKSDDAQASVYENSTLRIYNSNDQLLRYYSPMSEAPENIYLVAGDYKITVNAGKEYTSTTSLNEVFYYGEESFTITAQYTEQVDVNCVIQNSVVDVDFDETVSATFDNEFYCYITLSDEFNQDDVDNNNVEFIKFDQNTTTGYFVMPEDQTSLSWSFYGKSNDVLLPNAVVKTGTINNVSASTQYTLSFTYSKTPDGYLDLGLVVIEDGEIFDDILNFAPQPAITGVDFEIGEAVSVDLNQDIEYSIIGINPLSTVTVTVDGTSYTAMNSQVVADLASEGIEYTAVSSTQGKLTLNSTFFDRYPTTGIKDITLKALDTNSAQTELTSQVNKVNGLVEISSADYDLWTNTTTLKAVYTGSVAGDQISFAYKEKDAIEWNILSAVAGADNVYTASVAPEWTESTNLGTTPTAIFTPNDNTGIFAGHDYEYKLIVESADKYAYNFSTSGTQSISNGDMEDDGLSCWDTSNSSSTWWASGNNSFTKSLCKQSTYTGMGGSYVAKLAGTEPAIAVDLAAGNLFLGQFYRASTLSTEGTVKFGQSFTWSARPRTFKVKYAASLGTVDANQHATFISKNSTDKARIYFAIVEWSSRHNVTSGTSSPSGVWDPETQNETDEGKIIGYASQLIESSTSGSMQTLELPIKYYDKVTKPNASYTIVISCATSAYGDYMNGSTSSVLYVDDFELAY